MPLDVAMSNGRIDETGRDLPPIGDDVVEDCSGLVVLAAPVEPHAHLDKALSGFRAPNPLGDLDGAIAAWHAHWPSLTHDDLVARAGAAVERMVLHGTTTIRTHVDVGAGVGLNAVEALIDVRDVMRARGLADLQIVGLVSVPMTGVEGAAQRDLLAAALDLGIDAVGGAPYRDPSPIEALTMLVDAADRHGLPLDVHTDETLHPSVLTVVELADLAAARGMGGRVTASHCVSLGVQPAAVQEKVAARLAEVGVAVVALPQTNLYLQSRAVTTSPARGLTAVRALLDAGATVAAGADNVRDPFCSMGRLDALETAALMVMAAHLTPADAWSTVTDGARAALGLPVVSISPGSAAEVLAVEGHSLADAIAAGGEARLVVHGGRVVARTTVDRRLLA